MSIDPLSAEHRTKDLSLLAPFSSEIPQQALGKVSRSDEAGAGLATECPPAIGLSPRGLLIRPPAGSTPVCRDSPPIADLHSPYLQLYRGKQE